MAASFPNAKKTFSAVVNGVTKLVASLFNSPYDEVEAIETFIGATGAGAQSYYTSITDAMYNYRRGCEVEYKSAADLYVRLGEIMITDASGNKRLRRNTSDTTVAWTDIDTGSEATSTIYYVYAVADSAATTFTVKVSTNAATPSGCTYYKRIGTFYNDSSGNIQEIGNLGRQPTLGTAVTKTDNTVYQAILDGVVNVVMSITDSTGNVGVSIGYCDASSPPTTVVGKCSGAYTGAGADGKDLFGSYTFHVKKDQYYKCTFTGTGSHAITFTPFN